MSPRMTSMRSVAPSFSAASRARSTIFSSTIAAILRSGSSLRSRRTRRLPMKPGKPVKNARPAIRARTLQVYMGAHRHHALVGQPEVLDRAGGVARDRDEKPLPPAREAFVLIARDDRDLRQEI